MPKQNVELLAFNRGMVSTSALGRVDVDRLKLTAQTMTNWFPKTLGPMTKRPGTKYLGATASNGAAQVIPFIAGTADTAFIEITNAVMRVWESDALITWASVTNNINNPTFAAQGSWEISASTGNAQVVFAGGSGGLKLQSNGRGATAKATQVVTPLHHGGGG